MTSRIAQQSYLLTFKQLCTYQLTVTLDAVANLDARAADSLCSSYYRK